MTPAYRPEQLNKISRQAVNIVNAQKQAYVDPATSGFRASFNYINARNSQQQTKMF